MNPVFRTAGPSDIALLLQMMKALWDHDGVPFDGERSKRAALQLMREPQGGTIWIIETAGAPVGYLILTHAFSLEFDGWHGFIDEVFIEAEHRGHGLGTAAVHFAIAECAARGMKGLLLEAAVVNESATRLYRQLGFREHPRRLMSVRIDPDASSTGCRAS